MRKFFLKSITLLFLLVMGINTAWAGEMLEKLAKDNPEAAAYIQKTLAEPSYCARLTGQASSTGGGKVYVTADTNDPRNNAYKEGTSNVAVNGMGMSMAGMTQIPIIAWAKPEDGYFLAGWSYSNMGTDLGTASAEDQPDVYQNSYDIGIKEGETIDHVIYATFEPIRLTNYTVSGDNTTNNRICDQTVVFTLSGTGIDGADFNDPSISAMPGTTGTWSVTSWNCTNGEKVSVQVHFEAPNTDAAEYSAELVLSTKANVSMKAVLNARTALGEDVEAICYDKDKKQKAKGSLSEMISAATATDVIKLNQNINHQVVIAKAGKITIDLNGYNITSQLSDYTYTPNTSDTDPARIAAAALLITNNEADVTIPYSPYGGKIVAGPYNDAIDMPYGGKLTLNGGTLIGFFGIGVMGGEINQNGATIVGTGCAVASMGGSFTMTDGNIYGMVGSTGDNADLVINGGTIDNKAQTVEGTTLSGGTALQVGGGKATIQRGTIKAKTYGIQNGGGIVTTEKRAVITGDTYALDFNGGKTTINCGKFDDPYKMCNLGNIESKIGAGLVEFVSVYTKTNLPGGTNYWGIPVWRNTSGAEFREGYEFFIGTAADAKKSGVSVCHIGGNSYSSLEDALAYANNTNESVVIIMDNDYTLPAGYYTLPANATLLVPMSNDQGAVNKIVPRETSYSQPTLFRKLTLVDGVNLDVFGSIEISGTQFSGSDTHTGSVIGSYGQLQMNKGSRMTLQDGSVLRAWGFVTGDIEHKNAQYEVPSGEIDARRGAMVYEMFQMGDWGNTAVNGIGLLTGDSRFPITSYFIQNVEVPVKYHPGAKQTSVTTVYAATGDLQIMMCANDIQIIGVSGKDIAMFLMDEMADAENTWVRKWYDSSKDQQVYEVNSGAHIGNLVINLASSPLLEGLEDVLDNMSGGQAPFSLPKTLGAEFHQDLVMNSGQYVLPITSNFKLHLLSGQLDFTQDAALIPGSELEIDKEATVFVTDQDLDNVLEGHLYIYDYNDWEDNAAMGQPAHKIQYTPVFADNEGKVPDNIRDVSTREALGHAIVNVHGTLDTRDGYIYTSPSGGNIFSSLEDAGTFNFTKPGTSDSESVKVTTGLLGGGEKIDFKPASLRNSAEWVANGGDEYTSTDGTKENNSYCYMDIDGKGGHWALLEQRDCFTYDEGNDIYYIKPQEYIAVTVSSAKQDGDDWIIEGNEESHTFSDAAGAGRLFILTYDKDGNCQWWEVEQKDNYYHCIHPNNDTYYEWKDDEWQEVRFTITWLDWDGTKLTTYEVPYGTQAEWLSTNPTRPADVDYTYDFTGWSPAPGKVTSNVTYTATYKANQIKYTVIFENEGGVELDRQLLARNEVPVCEYTPTKVGFTLEWSPAIAAVTGNATYVATWLPNPPTKYEITFFDYDGTTELQKGDVNVGDTPTPPADPTGKPATREYTYVFDHWSPAVEEVSATGAKSYTAVYREEQKTYTVIFQNEDGSEIERNDYVYGATPVCSKTPTKEATVEYTYSFAWSPQIQTVMGNATYKAVFTPTTNKYTVTLRSNISGVCTFTGAGIYNYGETANVAVLPNTGYEIVSINGTTVTWTADEETGEWSSSASVASDITLTAVVKEKDKPAPGDLELGLDATKNVASATDYTDVVITSDGLGHSSEIINANNITLYGNADFVLQKHMDARHWYDIAVPWRVDAANGIFLNGSTTPAVLGTDIEVFYYDGATRAKEGKVDACWVSVKNQSKKVLEPGRAYLFLLYKTSVSSVTFRKKVQEPLLTMNTSVQQYNSMTGDDKDGGWNGIANPALFKAYLNAGTEQAQTINANGDGYEPFTIKNAKLVVGKPVYVQTTAPKSPVVANSNSYGSAPARRSANNYRPTRYEVIVSAEGANIHADRLIIRLDESKEEETYVIGKDLAKFGTGSTVAQMWINRYDTRLCVNTVAPEGDVASFPMSVYAPKTGDYTIAIENESNAADYALYLTKNGEAIANLSDGAYTLSLDKGTTDKYGLRIGARVPQVATDLDAAIVDADGKATKVLYHGQVFIIRGEKVYTVDGQLVK